MLRDGDLLLTNGGIIRNEVLIAPLHLMDAAGSEIDYLGIDAVEVESLLPVYDELANMDIHKLGDLIQYLGKYTIRIYFSFEEMNEEYAAGTGSLLPAGTMVSADDLLLLSISSTGATAQVVRSGADSVPSPIVSIVEGFKVDKNVGLDAAGSCLPEDELFRSLLLTVYFSTEENASNNTFTEGDLLIHQQGAAVPNAIVLTNAQLVGDDSKRWGLDGVDLYPMAIEPIPTFVPTRVPTRIPTRVPTDVPTRVQPDVCPVYFSIEEPHVLPNGGTHGDILVHNPGGLAYVLPGGKNQDLLSAFLANTDDILEYDPGLDGFDILELDSLTDDLTGDVIPGATYVLNITPALTDRLSHKIIFTIEQSIPITNANHPSFTAGAAVTLRDGDLLLTNGGIIRNEVLIEPLNLMDANGNEIDYLGIDAVETEAFLPVFDHLANIDLKYPMALVDQLAIIASTNTGDFKIRIYFSFEDINEEYIAGTGSLLPAGTRVSADDLLVMSFSPAGMDADVVRSGADGIPSPIVSIVEGFNLDKNVGLDAVGSCLAEDTIFRSYLSTVYFSTEENGPNNMFSEGDLLIHTQGASVPNAVVLTNYQLVGSDDANWGLDGVDLYAKRIEPIPTEVPTREPTRVPTRVITPVPTEEPPVHPEDCPVFFSIEEPGVLPNGGTHSDILVHRPSGPAFPLPGGKIADLLKAFTVNLDVSIPELEPGLDGFDIIQLDFMTTDLTGSLSNIVTSNLNHKVIFTIENNTPITNPNHPLFTTAFTVQLSDGDLLFTNGGIIRNHTLIGPLDLTGPDGTGIDYLGIDAVETEGFLEYFDEFAYQDIRSIDQITQLIGDQTVKIYFSFEEYNEEYIAGTSSLLPAGRESAPTI